LVPRRRCQIVGFGEIIFRSNSKGKNVAAMKNHRQLAALTSRQCASALAATLAMSALVLVTGCSKPVEKTEDVRPVRTITLSAEHEDVLA
jgi:hypothetical protein